VRWLPPLVAMLVVAACGGPSATHGDAVATPTGSPSTVPADAFRATVVRVVDGDTFIARRDGHEVRVRLIGVNAPESVKPDSPGECYGPEASRFLHGLLAEGSQVRAAHEAGGNQDQFDRELWDVWLPDGRFLQGVLVSAGAAEARLYRPQHEYADLLARLGDRARATGAGLWGRCRR
jgi:micrococcal nuclease